MAWKLKQIEGFDELGRLIDAGGRTSTIGCWWYERHDRNRGAASNGMQVNVVLPPGGYAGLFQPYRLYPNDQGWTVQGEWPNVTVTPSIHCVGTYHGYITNGEVTDDVDGRKF